MAEENDIDGLVIVPPEKPLKMRAQPIVPPSAKRLRRKLWLKVREAFAGNGEKGGQRQNGGGSESPKSAGGSAGGKSEPWYGEDYARLVHKRRRNLSLLVAATVLLGLMKWVAAMPSDISVWTQAAVIILFILTFGWIALYFWSGVFGFCQLLKRAKMPGLAYPKDVDEALAAAAAEADGGAAQTAAAVERLAAHIRAKTAVLMPVYNEDPSQTMARILAIGEDLLRAGGSGKFDFFVLSDTTNPKVWVKEEAVWYQAKRQLEKEIPAGLRAEGMAVGSAVADVRTGISESAGGTGVADTGGIHLYYRRRAQNTARKSGNIEDFCNRWGAEYDFMIVLDADSLMTAETIAEMVRLMEANGHAGIIQASPQMINSSSMFARQQQFAGKIAGPIVGAGLAYWQAGNSNYWGHNAIIRTRAFIDCCGLPKLKGKGPFGGFILSHDFVEAALIARGGWSAWLLPELKGSYEECPPSMIDFAVRDRRWCQGNLQHIKVLISRGLHPVSRVHFLTGIMSYLSSPLWMLFLLAGVSMVLFREFIPPQYFGQGYSLFPNWPVFDKFGTVALFVLSMAMLLVPKFLGMAIFLRRNGWRKRAGKKFLPAGKAWGSLGLEIVSSTLMAPVMMLFQSKFVFDILCGKSVSWNAQNRGDDGTSWRMAWQIHKWHMILGAVTAVAVWKYAHALFWWLSPVTLGLVLSVPMSVISSRAGIGRRLKAHGWLLIPEEAEEPEVLSRTEYWVGVLQPYEAGEGGWKMLQQNEVLRRLHCRMLPVNGPAPEFAPEVAAAAGEKLAGGRAEELSKDEEMWVLYERAC